MKYKRYFRKTSLKQKGVGDLLVTVEVEIPTEISDKEVSLIEELANVMSKKTPKD